MPHQDADELLRRYPTLAGEVQESGKAAGWTMLHCALQRKAPFHFVKEVLSRTSA